MHCDRKINSSSFFVRIIIWPVKCAKLTDDTYINKHVLYLFSINAFSYISCLSVCFSFSLLKQINFLVGLICLMTLPLMSTDEFVIVCHWRNGIKSIRDAIEMFPYNYNYVKFLLVDVVFNAIRLNFHWKNECDIFGKCSLNRSGQPKLLWNCFLLEYLVNVWYHFLVDFMSAIDYKKSIHWIKLRLRTI